MDFYTLFVSMSFVITIMSLIIIVARTAGGVQVTFGLSGIFAVVFDFFTAPAYFCTAYILVDRFVV